MLQMCRNNRSPLSLIAVILKRMCVQVLYKKSYGVCISDPCIVLSSDFTVPFGKLE
jgi:hypothetical protein